MARTPAASVMSDDQDGPYRARGSKINSLAPGKFEWKFGYLIFHIISVTDIWGISCEFAFRWMSLDLTDDKSTLVQVMAWCHQATGHYLSQCWPRSLPPHGVTRSQWVIGIDTKIEVIVASPTTWEAHHSPRAKPKGCGELPRSLVTQQWPKWRYQFLFYHDETKSITNKQKNAR